MAYRPTGRWLLTVAVLVIWTEASWAQCRDGAVEGDRRDPARLARAASTVVHGTVVRSASLWIGATIYTAYEVSVVNAVKGPALNRIRVVIPGGSIDNVRTVWVGTPRIELGDEVLFFGQAFGGTNTFRPVGLFSGIVTVDRAAGTRILRLCEGPAPLDSVLSRIRSAVEP